MRLQWKKWKAKVLSGLTIPRGHVCEGRDEPAGPSRVDVPAAS